MGAAEILALGTTVSVILAAITAAYIAIRKEQRATAQQVIDATRQAAAERRAEQLATTKEVQKVHKVVNSRMTAVLSEARELREDVGTLQRILQAEDLAQPSLKSKVKVGPRPKGKGKNGLTKSKR